MLQKRHDQLELLIRDVANATPAPNPLDASTEDAILASWHGVAAKDSPTLLTRALAIVPTLTEAEIVKLFKRLKSENKITQRVDGGEMRYFRVFDNV